MSNTPEIAALVPSRTADASRLLARAFADDPGFVYALPGQAHREVKLAWLFERLMGIARDVGEVEVAARGSELLAVLAWFPPRAIAGTWDLVRHGVLQIPFRFGARSGARLVRCLVFMERARAEIMGDRPHWYLDQLAVDPAHQGQGLGRVALARGLEARLAREKAPFFLFTAKARNVPFYQGAGFKTVRDDWIGAPDDGFRIWSMIRES